MKTAQQIKERLVDELNVFLSVPGMCFLCEADQEIHFRTLLETLCFIDETEVTKNQIIEELCQEGIYYPKNEISGVANVFKNWRIQLSSATVGVRRKVGEMTIMLLSTKTTTAQPTREMQWGHTTATSPETNV